MLRKLLLAGLLVSVVASGPADAQLFGGTIHFLYVRPNVSTIQEDYGARIVGPGVEYPGSGPFGTFDVDIGASAIDIRRIPGGSTGFDSFGFLFNGFRFADVGSTLPAFTGLSIGVGTTVLDVAAVGLSFDADNLYVDLRGVDFSAITRTDRLVLNVTTATPVPEPATLALMGGGLLGLGAVARRRRRAA